MAIMTDIEWSKYFSDLSLKANTEDLNAKADIPVFQPFTGNQLILKHNTIFQTSTPLNALNIQLPEMTKEDFISEIDFSTSTDGTNITAPKEIKWVGEVQDGVFTPKENTRYIIIFYKDGINMRAVAQGVKEI